MRKGNKYSLPGLPVIEEAGASLLKKEQVVSRSQRAFLSFGDFFVIKGEKNV